MHACVYVHTRSMWLRHQRDLPVAVVGAVVACGHPVADIHVERQPLVQRRLGCEEERYEERNVQGSPLRNTKNSERIPAK